MLHRNLSFCHGISPTQFVTVFLENFMKEVYFEENHNICTGCSASAGHDSHGKSARICRP